MEQNSAVGHSSGKGLARRSQTKTATIQESETKAAPNYLREEWQALSLGGVLLGGLLDGLNPCVFLVLAMLLSYLILQKYPPAQLWRVGLSLTKLPPRPFDLTI